jgi:hypothetical protein
MSRYFFIGGFIGFALLFASSSLSGACIHVMLRNAMVGCIFCAFFFHFYVRRIAQLYVIARLRRIEEEQRLKRAHDREIGRQGE